MKKDTRQTWNVYFSETLKLICQVKANNASEAKAWTRIFMLEPGYRKENLFAELAA